MRDSTSPAAKSHDGGGRSQAARSAAPAAELGIGQIARQRFEPGYVYSAQPRNVAYLPVQSVVNRCELLSRKLVDVEIIEGANVVDVLRLPVFDEGRPTASLRPRRLLAGHAPFGIASCSTLAPYAAARCGLR